MVSSRGGITRNAGRCKRGSPSLVLGLEITVRPDGTGERRLAVADMDPGRWEGEGEVPTLEVAGGGLPDGMFSAFAPMVHETVLGMSF